MKSLSRHSLVFVAAVCCAICGIVLDCKAQSVSVKPSTNQVMRERIAAIFRETLQQGERAVAGRHVRALTYLPPPSWCVDEIRRYGDDAIPILAEYLHSGNGFEKYLAMRFLGLIGDGAVVEPLGEVALKDASPSFRFVALLWLAGTPWDLASPLIRQIANNDSAAEVREKAKEILLHHELAQ